MSSEIRQLPRRARSGRWRAKRRACAISWRPTWHASSTSSGTGTKTVREGAARAQATPLAACGGGGLSRTVQKSCAPPLSRGTGLVSKVEKSFCQREDSREACVRACLRGAREAPAGEGTGRERKGKGRRAGPPQRARRGRRRGAAGDRGLLDLAVRTALPRPSVSNLVCV